MLKRRNRLKHISLWKFWRKQQILRTDGSLWSVTEKDWPLQDTEEDGTERYPTFCTGMLYIYTQKAASIILSKSDSMPCLGSLDDVWVTGYLAKLVRYSISTWERRCFCFVGWCHPHRHKPPVDTQPYKTDNKKNVSTCSILPKWLDSRTIHNGSNRNNKHNKGK